MVTNSADKTAAPSDAADDTSYGFFYGTLMAPEVFYTVCYRTSRPPPTIAKEHVFRNAVLPGYTRHRVKHQEYPGILPDDAAGACVRGMLVGGMTAANQYHLDVFEGSEYERRTVEVVLDDGDATESEGAEKKTVTAQVYVYMYCDGLEHREWDFDEFRREKMHNWTRADYTFDGCDPDDPATVAA